MRNATPIHSWAAAPSRCARGDVARAGFQCQQQLERPVAQGPQGRLSLHPVSL